MLIFGDTAKALCIVFMVMALGYCLGKISFFGVRLGTAGIFIVGLLFGHLGFEVPTVLQTMGLILFISSVGLSAGPGFFQRLRATGASYALLCLTTAATGGLLCWMLIRLLHVETPLATGIMTGAFTTSPGFAAAKEAAQGDGAIQVAAGYGIAYPVGVLCKVLYVQMVPKLLHADMDEEVKKIAASGHNAGASSEAPFRMDKLGFFVIAVTIVLGIQLGAFTIPLRGGGKFALGTTGGPLIIGLLIGALGHIGPVNLRISPSIVAPLKEIGCALFFVGAGIEGGHGIAKILTQYGAAPLLYALIFVTVPLTVGFVMFHFVLKLPLLNGLSAMTASMTCTPSLAMLTQLAGTDDVAVAYATTYPIALVTMILVVQFLMLL